MCRNTFAVDDGRESQGPSLRGRLLALFGYGAISELSLLSGVKRKLDFVPAKGSFWREAAICDQALFLLLTGSDSSFATGESSSAEVPLFIALGKHEAHRLSALRLDRLVGDFLPERPADQKHAVAEKLKAGARVSGCANFWVLIFLRLAGMSHGANEEGEADPNKVSRSAVHISNV